jgi:Ca-activated chloride channel family protein
VNRAAPSNVRLFSFGVGDDVDTILLDSLSDENHGASAYVRPKDDIAETVSGFYDKVQSPVLADLSLDFGSLPTTDVYPDPLPDLFSGSQLVVVGRYRQGGAGALTLTGQVNGLSQKFVYDDLTFANSGGADFIPRLWATRKIGYLLNQIRLKGENAEMVKAIVDLSVRYGVVTPYTSYLVTEPNVLSAANRDQIAADESLKLQSAPMVASGGAAVDASVAQGALQSANTAGSPVDGSVDGVAQAVKYVGIRTFLNVDGVWTDTQFDSDTMTATPVQFGSDNYLALAASRPELASAFALGKQVIVVLDGTAYQVVPGPTNVVTIPATATPEVISGTSQSPLSATPTHAPLTLDAVKPPSNNGLWLWVGVCTLAVLAVVGGVWFWRRK